MSLRLSILIATVGLRGEKFNKLVKSLKPQLNEEVEVVVFWDNFQTSLGKKRQKLLEEARGQYVCFVDDDDEIPTYYVEQILANLGEDYVGWKQQLIHDGKVMKPTFHSLKYATFEDDDAWYAGVTHLNPIKREIALKGRFDITSPEDVSWASQVHPKTERVVPEEHVMYLYHHSTGDSLWTDPPKWRNNFERPQIPERFRYVES